MQPILGALPLRRAVGELRGRALGGHRRGGWFDPSRAHQSQTLKNTDLSPPVAPGGRHGSPANLAYMPLLTYGDLRGYARIGAYTRSPARQTVMRGAAPAPARIELVGSQWHACPRASSAGPPPPSFAPHTAPS